MSKHEERLPFWGAVAVVVLGSTLWAMIIGLMRLLFEYPWSRLPVLGITILLGAVFWLRVWWINRKPSA